MSTTKQVEENKIRELYNSWVYAVDNSNREQYLSLLDDDIIMIPPGAKDVVGKAAYAEFLIPVFAGAEYKVERLGDYQIEIFGDCAVARYDYDIKITLKDGTEQIDQSGALNQQSNNMKYHDVLIRRSDGNWKVLRHMWNDNVDSEV